MERATPVIDMQQIKNILQAQEVKYKQLKDIDGVYITTQKSVKNLKMRHISNIFNLIRI